MSSLKAAVIQLCKQQYSVELILSTESHLLAYSILSGKSIEEIKSINPKEELNDNQFDDFQAIQSIINELKRDLKNYNSIL